MRQAFFPDLAEGPGIFIQFHPLVTVALNFFFKPDKNKGPDGLRAEITTPDGTVVTDAKQIFDFISNVDTKITREIEQLLGDLRSQCSLKPLSMKSTEEQIKKGAPATYEVPVTFDTANFFG